jgi:hypothetical protein
MPGKSKPNESDPRRRKRYEDMFYGLSWTSVSVANAGVEMLGEQQDHDVADIRRHGTPLLIA